MHTTRTYAPPGFSLASLALSTLALATLALATLTPIAPAQDGEPRRRDLGAKLRKILEHNARLQSLAFETRHKKTNDASFARIQGMKQPKGSEARTTGLWSQELLWVDYSEAERVVFHGRRMIAKDDDNEWCLRRGHRANGKDLDFTLDPRDLFAALAGIALDVTHQDVGTVAGKPVQTFSATLSGDDARALLWAGSVPEDGPTGAAGGGGGVFQMIAARGVGVGAPRPDVTIDLAITFDPATRHIVRVKGRSLRVGAGAMAGNVVVRGFGLPGGGEAEEDEDEKKDEPEVGSYSDGLLVRSKKELKKATVIEFSYDFTQHDQAPARPLDDRCRLLLGLPSKR